MSFVNALTDHVTTQFIILLTVHMCVVKGNQSKVGQMKFKIFLLDCIYYLNDYIFAEIKQLVTERYNLFRLGKRISKKFIQLHWAQSLLGTCIFCQQPPPTPPPGGAYCKVIFDHFISMCRWQRCKSAWVSENIEQHTCPFNHQETTEQLPEEESYIKDTTL